MLKRAIPSLHARMRDWRIAISEKALTACRPPSTKAPLCRICRKELNKFSLSSPFPPFSESGRAAFLAPVNISSPDSACLRGSHSHFHFLPMQQGKPFHICKKGGIKKFYCTSAIAFLQERNLYFSQLVSLCLISSSVCL